MELSFSRRRDHKWKIPTQNGPKNRRHVISRARKVWTFEAFDWRDSYSDGIWPIASIKAGQGWHYPGNHEL
jgi:hypothetical protein